MSDTTVVGEKGRVVIPVGVRRQLGIRQGTELEIDVREGGMLMKPRRKVSAKDLRGIAGRERVNLEELESSLAHE